MEITSTSLCLYFRMFLPEMTLNGAGIGHDGIGADGNSVNGHNQLVYDRSCGFGIGVLAWLEFDWISG